jgi:hypothetical protein
VNVDLSALTLTQAFATLAVVAAFDVLGSIALSIIQGKFSLGAVATWIQSHVLKRVFPIFAMAVSVMASRRTAPSTCPAIEPAWLVAIAALAAYVLETVASIRDSIDDASPPADTTPTAN